MNLKAAFSRLGITYVLAYVAPFPLTLLGYIPQIPLVGKIPGLAAVTGFLPGVYSWVMNPLVVWTGKTLFGVEVALEFTGSGDRTFNYVKLVVTALLAVIIAIVWTAVVRARPVSPRMFDLSRVIARYYLGTTLLTYGMFKVFPLQFPSPGPDRLMQPYGDSSPMGLAWTFLGASAAYQIFAGASELIGGYLLFWRRTTLLGALVGAAVMTNVAAINFFYDVPVKLFSSHLLLVAIFLLVPDLGRLLGVVGLGAPGGERSDRPFWNFVGKRRTTFRAIHVLFILGLTGSHVASSLESAKNYGYLRERSELTGIYRVEFFRRGGMVDRENEDADRWVRVGLNPPSVATIQRATGDAVRMRLAMDEAGKKVSFHDRGGQPPDVPQFEYSSSEPGMLRLEGTFEGEETIVVMRLSDDGALLVERGYHWINEYPFNR